MRRPSPRHSRRLRGALAGAAALAALAPATALAEPVGEPFDTGLLFPSGVVFNERAERFFKAGSDDTGRGNHLYFDSNAQDRYTEFVDRREIDNIDVAANQARGDQLVAYWKSGTIRAMLVDLANKAGVAFDIAATTNDRTGPAVAFNAQLREYLVVWSDAGVVRGKRVSEDGRLLGSGVSRVSDRRPTGNVRPDVVARGSGWLVVWQVDRGGGESDVVGQAVASSGSDTGADDFAVSSHRNLAGRRENAEPAVALDADTREALVVFSDRYEIFGQRLSASSSRRGSNFRLSSMGPDGDLGYRAEAPDVAHHPRAREFLVAWHGSDLAPGPPSEVFGQHVSLAGAQRGADDFRLSLGPEEDLITSLDVAADPRSREYVVVWSDLYQEGRDGGFARRVVAP